MIGDGYIIHIYTIATSTSKWFDLGERLDYGIITSRDFDRLKSKSVKMHSVIGEESRLVWLVKDKDLDVRTAMELIDARDRCIY